MSAPETLSNLTARKRLLLEQADAHRHAIGTECGHVVQRMRQAREFVLLLIPKSQSGLGRLTRIAGVFRALRR
jgi:hypothetical protein